MVGLWALGGEASAWGPRDLTPLLAWHGFLYLGGAPRVSQAAQVRGSQPPCKTSLTSDMNASWEGFPNPVGLEICQHESRDPGKQSLGSGLLQAGTRGGAGRGQRRRAVVRAGSQDQSPHGPHAPPTPALRWGDSSCCLSPTGRLPWARSPERFRPHKVGGIGWLLIDC